MPEDFPRATLVDGFSMIYQKFPDWVGNFFINLEDLKRRDFSKVFYTWDCC